MNIEQLYQHHLLTYSDMQQHLPTLRGLAGPGDMVVEFGLRGGVSTTAFLAAGAKVRSYDIKECKTAVLLFTKLVPEQFSFKQQSSLKATIPECEVLFIDSEHTYETLAAELGRHAGKVRRCIAIHDTEKFKEELGRAVSEFLEREHETWRLKRHYKSSFGLTVLECRPGDGVV
jgi:hypothetical protein